MDFERLTQIEWSIIDQATASRSRQLEPARVADRLTDLREAAALTWVAEQWVIDLVVTARRAGRTWEEVAHALGVKRETARDRFVRYCPDESQSGEHGS